MTTWEPFKANLPGKPNADVYLMNLTLMEKQTLGKIVAHLSKKFGIPANEIEAEMAAHGSPILAEDCTVVLNDPQRWVGCGPEECDDDDEDGDWDDSDGDEYDELDEALQNCGKMPDGTCMLAGSEDCDWECPFSGTT